MWQIEDEEMKYKAIIGALVSSGLILASASSFAQQGPRGDRPEPQDRAQIERGQQADRDRDFDRDRLQDRDRLDVPSQDRDRDQDRTHVPDFAKLSDNDIYGSEVMSVQERNEYRNQLQNAGSVEERQRIESQHREMVQAKAKSQGVDLVPPGQGIYGGALMSVEERNQYREQLRLIESDEERLQFMAQHREEMQVRAKMKGVDLDDEEIEEAE
jgi:hypothetical protein